MQTALWQVLKGWPERGTAMQKHGGVHSGRHVETSGGGPGVRGPRQEEHFPTEQGAGGGGRPASREASEFQHWSCRSLDQTSNSRGKNQLLRRERNLTWESVELS